MPTRHRPARPPASSLAGEVGRAPQALAGGRKLRKCEKRIVGGIIFAVLIFFVSPAMARSQFDSDTDGLSDEIEKALGTDAFNSDTDGDGFNDGAEAYSGHNPFSGYSNRSLPRRVEVDLSRQQLHYYLGGVRLGTIPVSTGLYRTPTPRGEFKIRRKRPLVNYQGAGYNYPNTKWNLEFKPSYFLHGAYWHTQFGKRPMSHGCVNIAYRDVEKLYKFLDVGDEVKITGQTPLGLIKS